MATVEKSLALHKKLNIDLLYDPAIPLLDTQENWKGIQTDTCTYMFIAA